MRALIPPGVAIIGSTCVARRPGTPLANIATIRTGMGRAKPRGARTIASNQWRSVPRETPVALCRRVPADHLSPSVVGRARLGLVNDPQLDEGGLDPCLVVG